MFMRILLICAPIKFTYLLTYLLALIHQSSVTADKIKTWLLSSDENRTVPKISVLLVICTSISHCPMAEYLTKKKNRERRNFASYLGGRLRKDNAVGIASFQAGVEL